MKSLAIIAGVVLSILFTVFAITCTGRAPQANLVTPSSTGSPVPGTSASLPSSATLGNVPLHTLRDVPLSGGASRFDYQSFDPSSGRLYIAHLGPSLMQTKKQSSAMSRIYHASTASSRFRSFIAVMLQPRARTSWQLSMTTLCRLSRACLLEIILMA